MPIYEYTCLECGHEFEKLQKISEAPVRKCPACGRLKARRMISRTSFVLKGNGWYVTDYPSSDRKNALKAESGGNGSEFKTGSDTPSDTAKASSESKEQSKEKSAKSKKEKSAKKASAKS